MTEQIQTWEMEGLRERSQLLFGSPHRLPVAATIAAADEDDLYAAKVAARAGVERKDAGRMIGDFATASLLATTKRTVSGAGPGRPPYYFERRDDEFWQFMMKLSEPFRRA